MIKRILDGRTRIPLSHRGLSGNHPTAAVNLARLATLCAEHPGPRVLNSADPDTPAAADVVAAIAAACRRPIELAGPDHDVPTEFGWSPWASWPPYFLDTAAATALGYRPVGSYAAGVPADLVPFS